MVEFECLLFGGIANDKSHGLAHIYNYLFEKNIVY
jgi:hypothetical protein